MAPWVTVILWIYQQRVFFVSSPQVSVFTPPWVLLVTLGTWGVVLVSCGAMERTISLAPWFPGRWGASDTLWMVDEGHQLGLSHCWIYPGRCSSGVGMPFEGIPKQTWGAPVIIIGDNRRAFLTFSFSGPGSNQTPLIQSIKVVWISLCIMSSA